MISRGSRGVIIGIGVVFAGAAGMAVGRWLGERRVVEVSHVPVVAWQRGDPFPSLKLVTEFGDSVSSESLLAHGGIMLFLDVECPPCVEMAQKWDRAVNDGLVPIDRVVAVTAQSVEAIGQFRRDAELQIRVYRDPDASFVKNGWVTSFPAEVIVDRSGKVLAVGQDPAAPLDLSVVRAAVGGRSNGIR